MSECVDANRVIGAGGERRTTLFVREGIPDLADCPYVVQTGAEFVSGVKAPAQSPDVFFPVAIVVIFVLGWIAGAQR